MRVIRWAEDAPNLAEELELPGYWKLSQDLFRVWATPCEGARPLWTGRNLLDTAEKLYAFRKKRRRGREGDNYEEPADRWLRVNGYTPDNLGMAKRLIESWLYDRTKADTRRFGDCWIDAFSLPCGRCDVAWGRYVLDDDATLTGPYVKAASKEVGRLALREYLWGEIGSSATLDAVKLNWRYHLAVGSLDREFDYVAPSGDQDGIVLGDLVDRCSAFIAAKERRSILFYGPPGTGKSCLSYQLASEAGSGRVLAVRPKATQAVELEGVMEIIRFLRPTSLMLEDFDRWQAGAVESLLSLLEDDDLGADLVVASINEKDDVDRALLRPGRFDEVRHVGAPTPEHLQRIVAYYLEKYEVVGLDTKELTLQMEGFFPADVREVIRVTGTVGADVLDAEIRRVRRQHDLYTSPKSPRPRSRVREGESARR